MASTKTAAPRRKIYRAVKIIGGIAGVIALLILAYVAYVMLTYHRIADHQELTVEQSASEAVRVGREYTALTYNVGFGAYTPEYSFFMDGGKSSWASSKESVIATIEGAGALIQSENPDLVFLQEVDYDSTRSYHVDEYGMLCDALSEYSRSFAVNFDSPFLFYPLTKPHGFARSGMATFTRFAQTSAERRSLPVSDGFGKYVDLDRCYTITRIPVESGGELVVFNVHLSAYGSSDKVREGQLSMLRDDLEREVQAGSYVICAGDFNHDLLADESVTTAESWAYPYPRSMLPQGVTFGLDRLTEEERDSLAYSTRNTDIPFDPEVSYQVTVDGVLLSDNVELLSYETVDGNFTYSDHNPVKITFRLRE